MVSLTVGIFLPSILKKVPVLLIARLSLLLAILPASSLLTALLNVFEKAIALPSILKVSTPTFLVKLKYILDRVVVVLNTLVRFATLVAL